MFTHLAVNEHCSCIGTPRTPQINLINVRCGSQLTVLKNISHFNVFRSGSCRDVRIGFTMNRAIMEQCRRRTENKIGSTFNITIQEAETSTFCTGVNSILIAQKATIDKDQAVTFRMKRNCLPQPCSIILYRQVLKSDGTSFHFQSIGTESSHLFYIGMIIVGDNRIFYIFTDEIDVFQPRRKNNLFLIYTLFNQNCHLIIHKGADTLHCFGQRTVISRAVTGYNNRIFPLLRRG